MFKLLFVIVLMAGSVIAVFAEPRPYFTEPSLSPDRKEIAFVSGGDIWTVPATGGVASLLVSHSANEARPLYSPDGGQLAFISSRTGNGDIYLLTLTTGDLKRLTFDDGLDPAVIRGHRRVGTLDDGRKIRQRKAVAAMPVREPADLIGQRMTVEPVGRGLLGQLGSPG